MNNNNLEDIVEENATDTFAGEDAKQSIPPYQRKPYDGGSPSLRPAAPGRPSSDLIVRDDTNSEISSAYFSIVNAEDEDAPLDHPGVTSAVAPLGYPGAQPTALGYTSVGERSGPLDHPGLMNGNTGAAMSSVNPSMQRTSFAGIFGDHDNQPLWNRPVSTDIMQRWPTRNGAMPSTHSNYSYAQQQPYGSAPQAPPGLAPPTQGQPSQAPGPPFQANTWFRDAVQGMTGQNGPTQIPQQASGLNAPYGPPPAQRPRRCGAGWREEDRAHY